MVGRSDASDTMATVNRELRILIVDDDAVDRMSTRRSLAKHNLGAKTFEASSLEECFAIVQDRGIDVVLLDLRLRGTSGLETLHSFVQRCPDVPVVVVSGIADERLAYEAIEHGAQDYISKDAIEHHWLGISLKTAIQRHELSRNLQESTKQLALANADLREFCYAASHDLQEPLRAITGYGRLLVQRASKLLAEDDHRLLDRILESTDRMRRLIEDLLALAHELRDTSLHEEVDLSLCVEDACRTLSSIIEETGSSIHCDSLPCVMANKRQMTQLFQNLISNAIKYRSEAAPSIQITYQPTASGIEILVADNGIGIAPEFSEKVFGLFQRLHHDSEYPGTGIGLALCKRIVSRHEGSMSVMPADGQGAIFVIRLPLLSRYGSLDS